MPIPTPRHNHRYIEGKRGQTRTCDIFCTVIDNFGDAAVCWRLARQLSREHDWQVRLFIDLPEVLAPLLGPDAVDAVDAVDAASIYGVHVVPWPDPHTPWLSGEVSDVVIEAFACTLPDAFLAAMAERTTPPVWVNLEYLSAEDWVRGCHLGRSPHPRLALTKTFFFPGLVEGTGGLLRERNLHYEKQLFLRDTQAQQGLWSRLNMTPPSPDMKIVTLFAYENPGVESLLDQWSAPTSTGEQRTERITAIVPVGRISPQIARWLGESSFTAGMAAQRGQLSVHAVPFVSQDDYDRLLWLADMNFVRGEDSFVRAQWAEKPFVWQIYPQSDDAHREKLDAALARYIAPLPEAIGTAVRNLWHAWNVAIPASLLPAAAPPLAPSPETPTPAAPSAQTNADPAPDWAAFWQHRAALQKHASDWATALQCPGSLSANLADFVESQLK